MLCAGIIEAGVDVIVFTGGDFVAKLVA